MTTIAPPLPGDPDRIADYRIIGRLGTGGMGTVYAALDAGGRRIAVKAVHPAQAADPQFRLRFQREVQVLRRVSGPCLVPLLDSDPTAPVPWLATDYVPGPTLQQHLATHGPLTGIQLNLFAAGTAGALTAIHAAGVAHRDLKPANVILSPHGPKVLDFGIAQVADGTALTATGVVAGTPGWISPEYYQRGISGPPGDVFAWGAMIAYAATGRLPFGSGQEAAVAYRVISEEADLHGVPAELAGIVGSCLAKDPARRPPAAAVAQVTGELLARQATQVLGPHQQPTLLGSGPSAVQQLIAEQWHQPAPDDPTWATAVSRQRRRRGGLILATALAVFALAGGATWAASNLGTHPTAGPTAPPYTSTAPATTPAATPALARTQVDTIAPWDSTGRLNAGVTVAGTAQGSCFTTAESTSRDDAFRCNGGNSLYDPCFAPLVQNPTAVMCLGTSPTKLFRLTLTEPLPDVPPVASPSPVEPLIIILTDGTSCGMVTGGTTDQAGQRLNYECGNGGGLYGYPDKTGVVWTISYLAKGSAVGTSVPIATSYQ
ncbi:serine/threonine-protein kinase [Streptacidiphilus sp. N1-3]|uniref:Serine/threonine-protein kinase n=1 Tax=Streptacidiphilus alkalitolerans TaxID=3342712 RepID=A0ABV6X5N7_9ACTN